MAGAAPQTIKAPSRLVLSADPLQTAMGEHDLPKWLGADTTGPLDARAAQMLNQSLDGKQPVSQVLREMADHRRAENRSLAARSLALIDEFEPFIDLLNDPDERAVWPIQIESLQAALARGPSTAAKVRTAFEKQRGKDAAELYRMLWGYTKDDLVSGEAARLVDDLDRDNLDFRVLSLYNLRLITNVTFNYRPEARPRANRLCRRVRRWRATERRSDPAEKHRVCRGRPCRSDSANTRRRRSDRSSSSAPAGLAVNAGHE